MNTNPDPNAASAQSQAPVEPKCALVVMCIECGQGIELPLPIDQHALTYLLAYSGWFVTVCPPAQPAQPTQPTQEMPMVLGPLCAECAQKVYPPEVYAAAEQRRQQLLQAAAQAAQAQGPR